MKSVKKLANLLLNPLGLELSEFDKKNKFRNGVVELKPNEIEIIEYVSKNEFSMASIPRLINTLLSCKYVVENDIPGDFVECGVWRGGNGILAKMIFELMGSDKKVWMFDTFAGMTKPSEFDIVSKSNKHAGKKFQRTNKNSHSEWCYASLEDVKQNCLASAIDHLEMKFIKGDVSQTLLDAKNLPEAISVLRLDTDFYESTKIELQVMYPILSHAGVLIIDDYGYWQGSKKAVDEYFIDKINKPLFNVVDFAGRSCLKI
jgi:O-methyltransferase